MTTGAAVEDGGAPAEGTPPPAGPAPAAPPDTTGADATPPGAPAAPTTEQAPDAAGASATAPALPVIELVDVSVAVGGKVLLEHVDLTVRAGERVLLVGPSGAGKSVLLRLLTGLLDPGDDAYRIDGQARVAGVDVLRASRPAQARLRDAVGIVFQDHALLDELTARDNVLFARDHAASSAAGQAAERALTFLVEHGIDPGQRVRTLSGGQRQRVAVARALVNRPSILLADEPTGNLDSKTGAEIMSLFEDLADRGHTIIVVTHEEEIARHARRILRIRDGLIASDEKVDPHALVD